MFANERNMMLERLPLVILPIFNFFDNLEKLRLVGRLKLCSLLVASIFMSACITRATGPSFEMAPTPPENPSKGVVYVFRSDGRAGFVGDKQLYVNGKHLLNIADGGFTWLQVDPGLLELAGETALTKRPIFKAYNPPRISVQVNTGETIFVHYNVPVKYLGQSTNIAFVAGSVVPYSEPNVKYGKETLREITSEKALKLLKGHKYQPITH